MKSHKITIGDNEAQQRCDNFLKKYLKNSSPGNIFKMLRKKIIRINGRKTAANYTLQKGDIIEFRMSQESFQDLISADTVQQVKLNFQTISEDKNILAVNKPRGIITHPDRKNNTSLTEMIQYYLYRNGDYNPENELTFSPSSINRLDVNTSGVVIFAKNYGTLQSLNKLIRDGNSDKRYLTLVRGRLEGEKKITAYLTKNKAHNTVQISHKPQKNNLKIITQYKALQQFSKSTLLEVKLLTGRTHQIRAHLSHLGHPVAGDPKYGDADWNEYLKEKYGLKYQFLHCCHMSFTQACGKLAYINNKAFSASLPEDLKRLVNHSL